MTGVLQQPFQEKKVCKSDLPMISCQRPYHVESTGSRPITEVKQRRAWLVLGWVTAWEHQVQLATFFFPFFKSLSKVALG